MRMANTAPVPKAPVARKPASKECQVCNHRFPVTDMVQIEDYVNTGKSGWSLSFDLSGNKRNRAHTGRRYYRKKSIWVCGKHAKSYKREIDIRRRKYWKWAFVYVAVFALLSSCGAILEMLP